MLKLRVMTLISLLLLMVAVGCSSSDQAAIDKAVSPTLAAAQPATATATAAPTFTSTPELLPTDTPVPEPPVIPNPEPTAEPTPLTISTELSNCVTLVAYLASNHWHNGNKLWHAAMYQLQVFDHPDHYKTLRSGTQVIK